MEAQKKKINLEDQGSRPVQPTLAALLAAGHHHQAVDLLRQVYSISQQTGVGALADILAAALEIRTIMSQCHAQAAWHRQAAEEARQHEQQLVQRFETMVALAQELGLSELPLPAKVTTGPQTRALARNETSQTHDQAEPQAAALTHVLAVTCLGAFDVTVDDQSISDWNGLKARSIFKYLVVHHGTPVAKDRLMNIFWPEAEPEAARRNLHQAIFNLRRGFKPVCGELQIIRFEHDAYSLNPDLELWLDYAVFEDRVQAGQRLEAADWCAEAMAEYEGAAELYHGDFLEEDLFEDWTMLQREYLRGLYLDVTDRLSEYCVQQERYGTAMALCQKILSYDNCHEPTHRRLIRCYLAQNHRLLAVQQYQTCIKMLREDLGVAPAAETQALFTKMSTGMPSELTLAEAETLY